MRFFKCLGCKKLIIIKDGEMPTLNCRCKSVSFQEIDLNINFIQGVSIMEEQVVKKIQQEVETWCQENKLSVTGEVVLGLISRLDDSVKIGNIKKKKIKLSGPELDTYNGACRAIEQHINKMDANTRANVALILSEVSTKIGIKFSDMLIGKYNLDTVMNLSKSKESQVRDKKRAEQRAKKAQNKKKEEIKKK